MVYLRAENGSGLTEERAKEVIEGDFGFGLRSFETTNESWEMITGIK